MHKKKSTPHEFSCICCLLQRHTCTFPSTHVSYYRTRRELEPKPRFLHNPRGTLQRVYLLLLEHRGKFTARFLADNARKLAVIPTVEMCQLLMGLSIEMPFPEDLRKIDIVVLTVTLQTTGSHTLTHQFYHSSSVNTPLHVCYLQICPHISNLFFTPSLLLLPLKQFASSVMPGNYNTT